MRLAIICAGLLVLTACGQGAETRPEATPPPDQVFRFELTQQPDPLRSGQAATWVLALTNTGDEEIVAEMPSGQKGDIVLRRDGQEVYRWSEGRAFTMALVNEAFEPGETKTFELEEDELDVEPGDYQLEATSTAVPQPSPITRTVRVE